MEGVVKRLKICRNTLNFKVLPLYMSCFLDFVGFSMVTQLLVNHASKVGRSSSFAFILGATYDALQMFTSPFVGEWSDQTGYRTALLSCLLLSSFGYGLLALGSSSMILLFVARILLGIFEHSQRVTRAYLIDVAGRDEQAATLGRYGSVASIGFIIGPAVGGLIADLSGGFYWVTLLTSAIFLINFVNVWYFVEPDNISWKKVDNIGPTSTGTNTSWNILNPFRKVDMADMWDLFLITFLLVLSVYVLRNYFTRILIDKFEISSGTSLYITSFNASVSTLVGFCAGGITRKYGSNNSLALHVTWLQVVTMVMLSLAPNLWMFMLALIPLSVSTTLGQVSVVSLTLERGDQQDKGKLMGLNQSLVSLAKLVSHLVASASFQFGPSGPTIMAAVFSLLAVCVFKVRATDRGGELNRTKMV